MQVHFKSKEPKGMILVALKIGKTLIAKEAARNAPPATTFVMIAVNASVAANAAASAAASTMTC